MSQYENVIMLPQTNQLKCLYTIIRDRNTRRGDFIFYSDRIIRLLVEEGLNQLPVEPCQIHTPLGVAYDGHKFQGKICGVSIIRAGESMEQGLRDCCRSVRLGKILIQRDEETATPKLFYVKLPEDIPERYVFLLDPLLATGGSASMAVDVLLQKGVKEERILFLNVLASPEGIEVFKKKFPKIKVITGMIDQALDEKKFVVPGLGDFGDRYYYNGSGTIRAGFAGDEKPKINHSNLVGRPKYNKIMPSAISQTDTFIGSRAQQLRGLLKLKYPLANGIVDDWESLELVWSDVVQQLEAKTNQHPLLVSEHPLNPSKNRDRLAELVFETFNFPALYVAMPAVLSLYSSGRTTGTVLDSGDGVTTVVPIYDGFSVPGTIKRLNFGGRDITRLVQGELMKSGYFLSTSSEFELVRSLKERLCHVNPKPAEQHAKGPAAAEERKEFPLPDGKMVRVAGQTLWLPTELYFQPEKFGVEEVPVHQAVVNSVRKTNYDLRPQLFENIILAGGSTMFRNYGVRLLEEMKLEDPELRLKIYASPERRASCFVGGSILASLSVFKQMWVTKAEYEENPQLVHQNSEKR
ncbi:hypothetical protein KL946_004925 [Ogataea haglerorum]|uniref:Phosphoribosyltransferase domain-containing protein n=1 Tax=Ogataea haglerorum TaxID=1937702 RepID=A0ABQ7RA42_9ASCO|nr:hypothetical protein KL946_004925 [Ogataea haglerorum]